MRLLVVEDEKKVASFIKKGLEQEHYAVDVAHDGECGAHLAESFDYDLIILDVMLPRLSGMEVLRRIRQKNASLAVLMLTAKSTVQDRVTGLNLGADFERFYRADLSRSKHIEGSGLGLAMVRWIVEAHHGSVTVQSQPGAGTTVTVMLLAAEIPAAAARTH